MKKATQVSKVLRRTISQLNDIVAEMDGLVSEIGQEYFRVCIFGSARIASTDREYALVQELAGSIAKRGCDIITGGGPGLMEAANIGAKEASSQARSIGVFIDLPFEVRPNQHLDVKYHHRRFSSRLDEFMRLSHAVVVTPGGVGTILELMFTWQLMQVGHVFPKPIILLGRDYWSGLLTWMKDRVEGRGLMSASDTALVEVHDTVEQVMHRLESEIVLFEEKLRQPIER